MKQFANRFSKAIQPPFFPLLLILAANIIIALFTYRDYGLSWDEPLFYQYADAVPYAYSIPARLNGSFDIQKAYGPSAEDHKIYGPIYLLLAKPAVDALDGAFSIPRADLWHLVNFITFQVGVALFYVLCLRWMKPWAAFGATLLFSTQPLVWGHAWINPKDIPFTVFFLGAIYTGFRMVDALSEAPDVTLVAIPSERLTHQSWWQPLRKFILITGLVLASLTLLIFIATAELQGLLRSLIHNAYLAPPQSFLGRLFNSLATNAPSVAEEAYINKGLALFSRFCTLLIGFSAVFVIPSIFLLFWNNFVERGINCLGFALAPLPKKPAWGWKRLAMPGVWLKTVLAGILLGLLVSIRVVGPLAGVLVCLYFFFKHEQRSLAGLILYAVVALLAMYIAWPYLWDAPIARFIDVLQHMSHNPKVLPVLFRGTVYPSDHLPRTYLPVMLAITLTWPVWPLFLSALVIVGVKLRSRLIDWRSLAPVILWFMVPFIYVLLLRPPMYDGYRHFLFLLPPVFILCGLAFQAIGERLQNRWRYALSLAVFLVPGLIGLARTHPYEYAYYNLLTSGTGGAFRQYETDFWLTCYKELMGRLDEQVAPGATLFVHRQPSIARQYASPGIVVERFDPDDDRTFPGSLLLLTTRANVDLSLHPEAPEILSVGKDGATFCLVKAIP